MRQQRRRRGLHARPAHRVRAREAVSEPGAAPTTGTAGDPSIGAAASEAVSDASITTKVKTSLLADPDVSGLRIDVDTRDGVVTLTGTVSSSAEKSKALDLAGKGSADPSSLFAAVDLCARLAQRRRRA